MVHGFALGKFIKKTNKSKRQMITIWVQRKFWSWKGKKVSHMHSYDRKEEVCDGHLTSNESNPKENCSRKQKQRY